MKNIGIYVHIPFCKSKCYYCDFLSFAGHDRIASKYIKALKKEIISRSSDELCVKTVYIGGGTPSYINEKYIKEIIETIRENYNVDDDAEISIEANPGTITEKKLKTYKSAGINRLSIGLQTSNDEVLKKIGRIHTFAEWQDAVLIAKKVGFSNINTDLIIALPGQTIYDIEEAIDKIVEMDLQHVSVYSLIMEEGTPLQEMYEAGEIELPDDEMERYMYWFAKRKLEDNGYIHYEISNFAKPGFASRHNLDCWRQGEYLGFGIGAASYENKIRRSNIDDFEKYIKCVEAGKFEDIYEIEEKQDEETQMNEYMMLGLRKISGVDIGEFRLKFSRDVFATYKSSLEKLMAWNLIEVSDGNIKLTKKGLDVANVVWEEFV